MLGFPHGVSFLDEPVQCATPPPAVDATHGLPDTTHALAAHSLEPLSVERLGPGTERNGEYA